MPVMMLGMLEWVLKNLPELLVLTVSCRALGQMWYKIASGGTFLQQHAFFSDASSEGPSTATTPAPQASSAQPTPALDDYDSDDEERDPNDVAPIASAAPIAKATSRDPYAILDDDEYADDYVDSDDDSD